MPRPRQRARLESGLKLDINSLARRGYIRPGEATGPQSIQWTHSYWGEIASGVITADMSGSDEGWFNIKLDGGLDQRIMTVALPRYFGGKQWYFMCPQLDQRCAVLWRPPNAGRFGCRQRWGRRVAYESQFRDRIGRAHDGKARINARLCSIGDFDPDEWSFPPKPKWMRWSTYNRAAVKFDGYDRALGNYASMSFAKFIEPR